MEGEDGVVGIILAGEEGAEAGLLHFFGEGGVLRLQLLEHGAVALLEGHLAQRIEILPALAEAVIIIDLGLERLDALLHLLRIGNVVPEAVALAGSLELLDLLDGGLELQRAAQHLERGLVGIESGFVFFKFKHLAVFSL